MDKDMLIFRLTQAYVRMYGFLQDSLGLQLKGLGFVLRRNTADHIFHIHGQKMFFDHRVAAAYCRLVAGSWNEPETHIFLRRVISALNDSLLFVDVGASVGEMVVDMCKYETVRRVVAFEPIPECADAIRKTAALNNSHGRIEVYTKLVNRTREPTSFRFDVKSPTSSSAVRTDSPGGSIPATTIDKVLGDHCGSAILLIDVEGYEAQVLQGAIRFIRNCSPLIIFEYNNISKRHFTLGEIQSILGNDYIIYRLTHAGFLDSDFSHSWNCVAFDVRSAFAPLCKGLLKITMH